MSICNLIDEERKQKLSDFQKKYNLKFKNIELLNQAFIHTSYTKDKGLDNSYSYERLEFFGDAVLKLAISEFLYNHYSDYPEGELTKLRAQIVSDRNIARYAVELSMGELLILSKNEKKQGGAKKESILACSFEALLGAIFIEYKDKGYKKALSFLEDNFIDDILSFDKKIDLYNPKAVLQEYTQSIDKSLPTYNTVKEAGASHKKTFFVEVIWHNEVIGEGSSTTIKKAQGEAALDAIKKLKIEEKL